jgi:hypothetical protein
MFNVFISYSEFVLHSCYWKTYSRFTHYLCIDLFGSHQVMNTIKIGCNKHVIDKVMCL